MANELIKYHTELNTVPLRKFTATEMNLFFSIISRMKDTDTQVVKFSFEQLRELSDYKATANTRFIDDLERTYDKLMDLRFGRRSTSGLRRERFVLFNTFDINGDCEEPYANIQVHEKALPLLNTLESWVRYSLTEFRDLNSTYSKTMFRLLKQYRTTGWAEFSKEDFFELLDIPKSYWNRAGDIDIKILRPIKEELTPLFRGFSIRKKYGRGRGKPVIGYRFTWQAEKNDADDFSQGEQENNRRKLFNIEHNGELTLEEKWRAKDRALGLKLGTHEADNKSQEKADRAILKEVKNRQDTLESLRGF